MNSVDELIVTELLLDNTFSTMEPAEIVALLSCFVFYEKSSNDNASQPFLSPRLEKVKVAR